MTEEKLQQIIAQAEQNARAQFAQIDATALHNQRKVLRAFNEVGVAERHLKGTTGYGYGDIGRDALAAVYARVFGAESAIVSPLITGGTHALSLALFGLLFAGDTLLSITGKPYDTLDSIINGNEVGSMRYCGIRYDQIDLLSNNEFDTQSIRDYLAKVSPKVVYITRSRGYSSRDALNIASIAQAIALVKELSPQSVVFVDNCYGEFCEEQEPCEVGADVVVGSIIKNVGGGIAPTGGYIVGKAPLIEQISYRFTAPGIGCEVGSYAFGYQYFFQGLFIAPHVVANALKGSVLFAHVFTLLGYETVPKADAPCYDIIRSIRFANERELICFIQSVQKVSPIDSNVVPYPWDMPGYNEQVIMAAGTFVSGASIELSADAPIKKPYIAYLQGALTYEHARIAVEICARAVLEAHYES